MYYVKWYTLFGKVEQSPPTTKWGYCLEAFIVATGRPPALKFVHEFSQVAWDQH